MSVTTDEATREEPGTVSGIGTPLIVASAIGSTFGIVVAQFLDDLGDGLLAEFLGADSVVLYNNRVEFTGVSDLAWGGGFVLCMVVGLFALFLYPTQRGHGVPRLVMLWVMLHVLRQALSQAAFLPFSEDSQLALAYGTLDVPPGLDVVIAAGGGLGLLMIALAAASAFLAFTPNRRLVSTARRRTVLTLWIALIPAVASAFAAIPYFYPDSQGLVMPGLPLAALIFLATLAAAPGTSSVVGPEHEQRITWPWGLIVFMVLTLILYLTILQGGVSIDPRLWGTAQ